MQQGLETVKESRQRSNFTEATAITANYSTDFGFNFDVLSFYQTLNQILRGTELVFAGFMTALFVGFGPSAELSWFSNTYSLYVCYAWALTLSSKCEKHYK